MCKHGLLSTAAAATLALTVFAAPSGADARDHRGRDWYEPQKRDQVVHQPQRRGSSVVVVRPKTEIRWRRPPPRRQVVVVQPRPRRAYVAPRYESRIEPMAWFAFGMLSHALIDRLTTPQHAAIRHAHVQATHAPIGDRIFWSDGGAAGSIVAVREGTSTSGHYCREFYRTVTIGGRSEQAYSTACMQPDGAWQLVSTR